jgi:hypothetical protein
MGEAMTTTDVSRHAAWGDVDGLVDQAALAVPRAAASAKLMRRTKPLLRAGAVICGLWALPAIGAQDNHTIVDELVTELAECSAYYSTMAQLVQRPDLSGMVSAEQAAGFQAAAKQMASSTAKLLSGNETMKRMLDAAEQRFDQARQSGQFATLFERLAPFCKRLFNDLNSRLSELKTGNVCRSDYPCRENNGP